MLPASSFPTSVQQRAVAMLIHTKHLDRATVNSVGLAEIRFDTVANLGRPPSCRRLQTGRPRRTQLGRRS